MQVGAYWRLRNALVADCIDNRVANKLLIQQGATDIHYLSQSDQYAAIQEYVRHDHCAIKGPQSSLAERCGVRGYGYERIFDAFKEGFRPPTPHRSEKDVPPD